MAECYCNKPQYILFEIFSKRWQLPLELNSTPLFDAIFFPFGASIKITTIPILARNKRIDC